MTDPNITETAKEFVDRVLAARGQLGYSARVSKKSYGLAVKQAASVFETLRATNGDWKGGSRASAPK
jgi:hypothetical protein